jgi:hypothetical protein
MTTYDALHPEPKGRMPGGQKNSQDGAILREDDLDAPLLEVLLNF